MYFAFPGPDGVLVRPGGDEMARRLPRHAVRISRAQYDQLKVAPRTLRVEGGQVVAVSAEWERDQAVKAKLRAVAGERAKRERAGMAYTFPDGITGTVQLRRQRDVINVNGTASAGAVLGGRGNTTATLALADQEGRKHLLTPSQAEDLGLAVSQRVTALYDAAWGHAAVIKQLATADEVAAYDITTGWPD